MTDLQIPNKCGFLVFYSEIVPQNRAMFTGIIEESGRILAVSELGGNRTFQVESALGNQLKVDQSLSHNGICLTVESVQDHIYQVTAVAETLAKTNAGSWKPGDYINLERAMVMNGRIDGHLVQGHVDAIGECLAVEDQKGSWRFDIGFPESFAQLVIEKGSIAVNGISLTAWGVTQNSFSVAIIPYTFDHTNLRYLKPGQTVNLEFDMIGKYIYRMSNIGSVKK
jgi:riboflavin synthase